MATTAGGLPYVEPSDLVSGWPAVSQALAEELDDQLAAKASLAGATYTGTHNFTGATITGIPGGLTLISAASFTTSSAINVNNVFSSTYDHYRIAVDFTAASATDASINFYYRLSGADTTSNYYITAVKNDATSITSVSTAGAGIAAISTTYPTSSQLVVECSRPSYAEVTMAIFQSTHLTNSGAGPQYQTGLLRQNSTTAFTGFSLVPSTGNVTGTYKVYGFQNS